MSHKLTESDLLNVISTLNSKMQILSDHRQQLPATDSDNEVLNILRQIMIVETELDVIEEALVKL
jgi:hypothetical protein